MIIMDGRTDKHGILPYGLTTINRYIRQQLSIANRLKTSVTEDLSNMLAYRDAEPQITSALAVQG